MPYIKSLKDFEGVKQISAVWLNDQVKDKTTAVLEFVDGTKAQGLWRNIHNSTGHYQGFMKDGRPAGFCTVTLPSGQFYQGHWAASGQISGVANTTLGGGRQYVGGWAAGKPSGFGVMVYLDNSKVMNNQNWHEFGAHYVGQWKDGLINGSGTVYYQSGQISFQGLFDYGACSYDCHSYYKIP
jgi:hypothetical protein